MYKMISIKINIDLVKRIQTQLLIGQHNLPSSVTGQLILEQNLIGQSSMEMCLNKCYS